MTGSFAPPRIPNGTRVVDPHGNEYVVKSTTATPITFVLGSIASSLALPMEPARSSSWVDGRGTKRKRHGKVARNRSTAKAARAARKKARR